MQKKSIKNIVLNQQQIDPYQLISILNKKLKSQSQEMQWYKKMYQTAQYQKKITINQLKNKKINIENLKLQFQTEKQQKKDYQLELEQLRSKLNKIQRLGGLNNLKNQNIKQSLILSPYSKHNISTHFRSKHFVQNPLSTQLSLQLKHSDIYSIFNQQQQVSRVLQQKNINNYIDQQQFVPCDIKLVQRTHKSSFANSSSSQSFLNMSADIMNQTIDQPISQKPAQFFCQDFLVFGPDVSELKKKRQQQRSNDQFNIKPAVLYAGNSKTHNQHVYTQIAMRCFPFGATVKRQFIESYQQLKDIIQFIPQNKLSTDCLILNLKGQPSEQVRNSRNFKRSNLSQIQYVICIKIPDFVLLAKDQKHYQRAQQQVWLVDKYFAIVSYYPFLDLHLNILTNLYGILMKEKLHKVLIQKQKFYSFDIRRNMLDLQKNQEVKGIIDYFKAYKPQLGESLFVKGHYYGTIPPEGQAEYYVAKLTAPIFMTTFSCEQMLLLLIAVFCQKSISFMSKDEGVATLCALFLINVLTPFPYSFSILLNVDQQKIAPFVFEYPFPMISTIKRTQHNIHPIIDSYASARIQKKNIKQESQRMILVDIDTNSIFYQGHQTFEPLIMMGRPDEQFMTQYLKVNSSYSKSFSFPKSMDQKKQAGQMNRKQQQRNKIIQDLQHTIKSHITKLPSFELTPQIYKTLMMLLKYVKSFAVEGKDLSDAVEELTTNNYHDVLRKSLLQKHPTKGELIQKIIGSQYYADYLNLFVQ